MLKIRLEGKLEEIETYLEWMNMDKHTEVLEVSKPYKNRRESEYFRMYIVVDVK